MSALEIKDDFIDAHIYISQIFFINNDIATAISWLEKALAFDPPQKDLIFNNMGLLYAKKGEYLEAIKMFERALNVGTNSESVYNNLGTAHFSSGNFLKAVEYYGLAVECRPSLRNAYVESVQKAYIEFFKDEEFAYISEAANKHLQAGITDEDLSIYDEKIFEKYGREPVREAELLTNYARALDVTGRTDEAVEYLKIALRIAPKYHPGQFLLGTIYMKIGKLDDARTHLSSAVSLNPNHPPTQQALLQVNSMIQESQTNIGK